MRSFSLSHLNLYRNQLDLALNFDTALDCVILGVQSYYMDLNPVELCMTVEELEEIYRDENREVQELFSLIKGDDFIIGQEFY